MRAHRVRFVPPKKQRATKRRFGQETFLHSPAGFAAKLEKKVDQYKRQDGQCGTGCGRGLKLATAQFESKVFKEDVENKLICDICQKSLRELESGSD